MADKLKARVFEITSQEPYVTEDKIKVAIMGHKSIKQALYICHDKDKYSQKTVDKEYKKLHQHYTEDLISGDSKKVNDRFKEEGFKGLVKFEEYYKVKHKEEVGKVKPKHWHCYIRFDCPMELDTIAKWFDTSSQNVEIKKGAGAFVDCLEYAVHDSESAKSDGKYPYPWEDCTTFGMTVDEAREMVHDKKVRRLKYGKDLSPKEALRMRVLKEGMTLRDCYDKYPLEFADDRNTLIGLRTEYLANSAPLPETRYNFFITGSGGVGKDTVGRGLARQFYPGKTDEEIFHVVKDINVPFEGYDGQPVIIWEDVRSTSLITKFGRDGVFRLFDINPSRGRHNIKYGSMPLTNTMNIMTSVEDYVTFLNNLAGEYTDKYGNERKAEDKNQAYRRFPFIVPITMDYMDIMVQSAYLNGDYNFQEYVNYNRLRGNLSRMLWDNKIKALPETVRKDAQKKIEERYLSSSVKQLNDLIENNRGLVDKALSDVNDIVESIFAEIDGGSNEEVLTVSENPTCCSECSGYRNHKCDEVLWQFCKQPFKDKECPVAFQKNSNSDGFVQASLFDNPFH